MIKSIRIKKFRQLENVYEENIGMINELFGSNGSGKTSFISFISWLIYGETIDYGKNDDMNIDTFKPFELIGGEIECDNDYYVVYVNNYKIRSSYSLQRLKEYLVDDHFPSIRKSTLPSVVFNVTYKINLNSLSEFLVREV